jgi:hypothetical protein
MAGPVRHGPNGPRHVVTGCRVTLAAELVVHDSAIEPAPGVGPETIHDWLEWGARSGSWELTWLVFAEPVERKTRVRISPAPSTAMIVPRTTSPVRTERRKEALPIDLRG